MREKKVKATERAKVDQNEPEEHSLVKSKHRNQNCGLKKIVLGGPIGKRGKKGSSKGHVSFRKGNFTRNGCKQWFFHESKGKDQKGKGKEGAFPQSRFFRLWKHRWRGTWLVLGIRRLDIPTLPTISQLQLLHGTSSRHTAWMASVPLDLAHHPTHVVLDLGCTQSIGSRTDNQKVPETYALYSGITTEFCTCKKSFVFANVWDKNLSGKLHSSLSDNTAMCYLPEFMCLRRATCPSYSPSSQMKNLEYDHWTGSKREIQLLTCTLLQSNSPQWDTLRWIWRVLRTSQSRVSDRLARRKL